MKDVWIHSSHCSSARRWVGNPIGQISPYEPGHQCQITKHSQPLEVTSRGVSNAINDFQIQKVCSILKVVLMLNRTLCFKKMQWRFSKKHLWQSMCLVKNRGNRKNCPQCPRMFEGDRDLNSMWMGYCTRLVVCNLTYLYQSTHSTVVGKDIIFYSELVDSLQHNYSMFSFHQPTNILLHHQPLENDVIIEMSLKFISLPVTLGWHLSFFFTKIYATHFAGQCFFLRWLILTWSGRNFTT